MAKRGGRGLLAGFRGSFPPASEREARMDDPTLRCENDAGNETRLSGLPIPSGGPIFSLSCQSSVFSPQFSNNIHTQADQDLLDCSDFESSVSRD